MKVGKIGQNFRLNFKIRKSIIWGVYREPPPLGGRVSGRQKKHEGDPRSRRNPLWEAAGRRANVGCEGSRYVLGATPPQRSRDLHKKILRCPSGGKPPNLWILENAKQESGRESWDSVGGNAGWGKAAGRNTSLQDLVKILGPLNTNRNLEISRK